MSRVHFVVPAEQRALISRAVAAETRRVAPFRLQQVVFDTVDGSCVERGMYLIAQHDAAAQVPLFHRLVQPLSACTEMERNWPASQRVFDAGRLQDLLADSGAVAGFGPAYETTPVLLPRGRLVLRGRKGLHDFGENPGARHADPVVEIAFQRCDLRTAGGRLELFSLSVSLLAGNPDDLFAVATHWQRRFDLTLDPYPHFVRAARLGAAKRDRGRSLRVPIWLEGRSMAETPSYPAVDEAGVLSALVSDLALNICAVTEGDADEHRLQDFEKTVHAIACLVEFMPEHLVPEMPAELLASLHGLQRRHERAASLKWLRQSLERVDPSIGSSALAGQVLCAAKARTPVNLRALAVAPPTRAWVLDLVAWAALVCRPAAGKPEAPDLSAQAACRQRLEGWLDDVRKCGMQAMDGGLSVRRALYQQLRRFDEALSLFGPILPRRHMLRYRMLARGALAPLGEWLTVKAMCEQLPSLLAAQDSVFPGKADDFAQTLSMHWRGELVQIEARVVTQLGRLSQSLVTAGTRRLPGVW